MGTLTRLNLEHNQISDEVAEVFTKALAVNTTLNICLKFNKMSPECEEGFSRRPEIANALHEIEAGKPVVNLENMQVTGIECKALAEALKHNKTLTLLDLSRNEVGAQGAQALAESLKKNNTLEYLSLSSNRIGDQAAEALAAALKSNT